MEYEPDIPASGALTKTSREMVSGPQNSFCVFIHGIPLIWHPSIASYEEAVSLFSFAKEIAARYRQPLRLSAMQLNLVETEWNSTLIEHAAFIQLKDRASLSVSHLNFPTEPLLGLSLADSTPDYLLKMFSRLVFQFNAEAWCIYCQRIEELVVDVLGRFQPEDSEEYQLQARLEDYLHEVRSSILNDLRERLHGALSDEYAIMLNRDEAALKEKEKVVLRCRREISKLLDAQKELVALMAEGIGKIESMHPELMPLRIKASLFQTLLAEGGTWSQKLLGTALLDVLLGVVPVVNGDLNDPRTLAVLSIRSALIELSKRHPLEPVAALCLDWNEGNRDDPLAESLRSLVIEQAREWMKTMQQSSDRTIKEGDRDFNGEWISFIPEKLVIRTKEFHGEVGILVRDKAADKITGCTREGTRLLQQLGFLR